MMIKNTIEQIAPRTLTPESRRTSIISTLGSKSAFGSSFLSLLFLGLICLSFVAGLSTASAQTFRYWTNTSTNGTGWVTNSALFWTNGAATGTAVNWTNTNAVAVFGTNINTMP